MERLPKLFLSVCVLCVLFSCQQSKREKAEAIYKRAIHYPQGSMMSINGIKRATEIDSTYAQAVYELSVAYLKRGLPHKWKPQYDKSVLLDSIHRIPWRGYLYLMFYRDYEKAISDFDLSDVITPNFKDAPQGQSVDYWRGIAYLGLKDYENSIAYFDTYINSETEEFGEDWVEMTAFLYRGIAYFESENFEQALLNFDTQLKHSRNRSADAKYYKAKILQKMDRIEEARTVIDEAIEDFNIGYFNNRPYVEVLRQLYIEDLEALKTTLQ